MSESPAIASQEPTSSIRSPSPSPSISPPSYTFERLKHASPAHLHITTRRFFIGPIPEGWLNSNRKSWYKRRLELHNFSSQEAGFDAVTQRQHRKTASLVGQPSLAARVAVSFPQPEDVYSAPTTPGTHNEQPNDGHEDGEEDSGEDSDEEAETRVLAPVATHEAPQSLGISGLDSPDLPRKLSVSRDNGMGGIDERLRDITSPPSTSHRPESFKTARETLSQTQTPRTAALPGDDDDDDDDNDDNEGRNTKANQSITNTSDIRPSTSIRTGISSRLHVDGIRDSPDTANNSSQTALLPRGAPSLSSRTSRIEAESAVISPKSIGQRTMIYKSPAPIKSPGAPGTWGQKAPGVRFKVAEEVAERRRGLGKRVNSARVMVTNRVSRRNTLQEGTIIKMERMLVRVDVTAQKLGDEFDENESVKTETKPIDKWREYMVVARRSRKQDDDDFRLQFYKSRVIPEIDTEKTRKKPVHEIKLLPKSTGVNLYSSLDKTIVIWHPYRKGTRVSIMKPSSTAHAVEWYTFLRDALGQLRPGKLQVNVPDLDVALHVDKPFGSLEAAGQEATDEETLIVRAAAAEQAVAGKIISQSMNMLSGDSEWSQVLQRWSETAKMGLAWKRYDRLEWVQGINERKMYGSMAMQHSYDLELRPKQHYPTETHGKKGVLHEEPAPIEGFLIRLTSQTGLHRRFGKAFFKRLYFSTYDNFLVFNRPARATPPHPPRLATLTGTNIPSSQDIVRETPTTFEINPFQLEGEEVKWLKSTRLASAKSHDVEAQEEARRNIMNLTKSDGYINMCNIMKVRKLKWGATDADESLDAGSDVDFHQDVDNTSDEDGTTREIDDDRVLELVLKNDLVVRLQAYSKETRNEWIKRLRKLVKYWKLRATADVNNLKSVRTSNLNKLNIDEEMEAHIGQFARKWEVSRSEASPELYNMCRLTGCRTITMSGMLYRKPRRHATFQRCGVLLTGGQILVYQAAVRKSTGEQVAHIHSDKQDIVDLKDCYVYSGLIVEEDLLYQNRTFDANQPGMLAATPRFYPNDGWTAADVDVMTCFVIWMNNRKGWFRSVAASPEAESEDQKGSKQSKLKRVAQLGVAGRSMVFKCRSRAERDLWVTSVAAEIEAAVERAHRQETNAGRLGLEDVRLQH